MNGPIVSFLIALVLFMFWATYSPNNILEADTRMFFYVSGTLCANLSCTLIVSQMSNTRCELINILLVPLALAVALCLFIPGLLSTSELTILYMLSLVLTVFHIHYGICVVSEMSTHLNIEPLRIKNSYDKVRLISSKKAKTDAQRFQIPKKNRQKNFIRKFVKLTGHAYAYNNLTNFEYKQSPETEMMQIC